MPPSSALMEYTARERRREALPTPQKFRNDGGLSCCQAKSRAFKRITSVFCRFSADK